MFHLKDKIVEPEEAPTAKQQPGKHSHSNRYAPNNRRTTGSGVSYTVDTKAIQLYNEEYRQVSQRRQLAVSCDSAVTVVSHEHESRGISTVRSHYQAMTSEDTTE
jgi:hypothetical protein